MKKMIFLIVLLPQACTTNTPIHTFRLTGIVYNEEIQPLSNAQISLRQDDVEVESCISKSDGTFCLNVAKDGEYTLQVSKKGYVANSRVITICEGNNNADVVLKQNGLNVDVQPEVLKFGINKSSQTLIIENISSQDINYELTCKEEDLLDISPKKGIIKAFSAVECIVAVNWESMSTPNKKDVIIINFSDGTNAQVEVTVIGEEFASVDVKISKELENATELKFIPSSNTAFYYFLVQGDEEKRSLEYVKRNGIKVEGNQESFFTYEFNADDKELVCYTAAYNKCSQVRLDYSSRQHKSLSDATIGETDIYILSDGIGCFVGRASTSKYKINLYEGDVTSILTEYEMAMDLKSDNETNIGTYTSYSPLSPSCKYTLVVSALNEEGVPGHPFVQVITTKRIEYQPEVIFTSKNLNGNKALAIDMNDYAKSFKIGIFPSSNNSNIEWAWFLDGLSNEGNIWFENVVYSPVSDNKVCVVRASSEKMSVSGRRNEDKCSGVINIYETGTKSMIESGCLLINNISDGAKGTKIIRADASLGKN